LLMGESSVLVLGGHPAPPKTQEAAAVSFPREDL
ncbi:TIGR01777 family oxidoreductase, partial [Enterobacter intestinihominis]